MARHLSRKRTTHSILAEFFWPGLHGAVGRFVTAYDVCWTTVARGMVHEVPLEQVPPIATLFSKVAVDNVGPLKPTMCKATVTF